jgi:hypothetical protein
VSRSLDFCLAVRIEVGSSNPEALLPSSRASLVFNQVIMALEVSRAEIRRSQGRTSSGWE